jgi:hypothetical protein
MLWSFKTIHNYKTDQVHIKGIGGNITLCNQSQATCSTVEETHDEEQDTWAVQEEVKTNNKEQLVPKQVTQDEDKRNHEQHQIYKIKHSTHLAGHKAARLVGTKWCKGWTSGGTRQQRHAVGSSELPSREVQLPSQENLQSPVIDHSVSAEQETQICVLMEDSNMPNTRSNTQCNTS